MASSPSAANLGGILLTNMNSPSIPVMICLPLCHPLLYHWKLQHQPAICISDIHKTLISRPPKTHFLCHDEKTQNYIRIHISATLAWVQSLLMKIINIASLFPSSLSSFCIYTVDCIYLFSCVCMFMDGHTMINSDCCPFWSRACHVC